MFPRDRARQDRNKGEIATSHASNNGGRRQSWRSRASVQKFRLAPRKRARARRSRGGRGGACRTRSARRVERPTREARRVRGPRRERARLPL
jgi:hypothetical protein